MQVGKIRPGNLTYLLVGAAIFAGSVVLGPWQTVSAETNKRKPASASPKKLTHSQRVTMERQKTAKNSKTAKKNAKTDKKTAALTKEKAAQADQPPAKQLFGAVKEASPMAARSIGGYARGCLAGGKMLPVDGPAWQAMRLSRNRNWGHPKLVKYVERLAVDAQKHDKWSGLLVGDLAQPRGGPMLTGHASHQIGLDADIWLTPMPSRILSHKEREDMAATTMLNAEMLAINPKVWTDGHVKLLKRAASYPEVARIFVHPAIKKALCTSVGVKKMVEVKVAPEKKDAQHKDAAGAGDKKTAQTKMVETLEIPQKDKAWMSRIRPWWGHHYHFHVRIKCPKGSVGCENQADPADDDGCGKELDSWMKRISVKPKYPVAQLKPAKPKHQMTLDELPKECVAVLGRDNQPTLVAASDVAQDPAKKAPDVLKAGLAGQTGTAQSATAQKNTAQTNEQTSLQAQQQAQQTVPGVKVEAKPENKAKADEKTVDRAKEGKDASVVKQAALPVPERKPAQRQIQPKQAAQKNQPGLTKAEGAASAKKPNQQPRLQKVKNNKKKTKKDNSANKATEKKDTMAAN